MVGGGPAAARYGRVQAPEISFTPAEMDNRRSKYPSTSPKLHTYFNQHEYTRYGFRTLIETRSIDILQPDVTWVGGLTELLKISAHAAAYDVPVVPHASSCYSYHFAMSQLNTPFAEVLMFFTRQSDTDTTSLDRLQRT